MRPRRTLLLVTAVTIGLLFLSGCSAPTFKSEIVKGTSITIATGVGFSSDNVNSTIGASPFNAGVGYLTNSWFYYYDSTPRLVENTKFGTETLVNTDPETVRYTINPGVKWSDGTPVTAADLLLDWASSTERNNNGVSSIVRNGKREHLNFASAHSPSGINSATKAIVSSDERSLTLVYQLPFADWRTALPADPLAAHAVYEIAYPGTKPATANKDVIKAIEHRNLPVLIKIANAWRYAFNFTDTPSNKLLALSDGPYAITKAVKNSSITLVANKFYNWGPLPRIAALKFKVIPGTANQVRALQSGEVNVISGVGEADSFPQLEALSGVTTSVTSSGSWDHVDLSEDNGGPFDPASYAGDASKARLVRGAFLEALPRQEMLDTLIRPIQPDATLDNSLTFLPGAAGYDASVAENGSSVYATVNIAKARADLKQAGVSNPRVRFLYPASEIRNAKEFALIQRSERDAGFVLLDHSSDDWSVILGNQSYDAALFAWQDTTLDVTDDVSQLSIFGTTRGDFNGFRSSSVDAGTRNLMELFDQSSQLKLVAHIDAAGWEAAVSAPLFQAPEISAWSNNIRGMKDSPLPPGILWNYWNWETR